MLKNQEHVFKSHRCGGCGKGKDKVTFNVAWSEYKGKTYYTANKYCNVCRVVFYKETKQDRRAKIREKFVEYFKNA